MKNIGWWIFVFMFVIFLATTKFWIKMYTGQWSCCGSLLLQLSGWREESRSLDATCADMSTHITRVRVRITYARQQTAICQSTWSENLPRLEEKERRPLEGIFVCETVTLGETGERVRLCNERSAAHVCSRGQLQLYNWSTFCNW